MAYQKIYNMIGFKNLPDQSTPLNAENLGIMENGINTLDDRVVQLDGYKANIEFVYQNFVAKVEGKGLSANDLTNDLLQKILNFSSDIYGNNQISLGRTGNIGDRSISYGYVNEASGKYSTAIGDRNRATGQSSFAEGSQTTSAGEGAHAEGILTRAKANGSHAEGNNTEAEGLSAHAEGQATKAIGNYSHAEGNDTAAEAYHCHAEGYKTRAAGMASHAEGQQTLTKGFASHAEGQDTIAGGNVQHVQGKYNVEDTQNQYAHIVGGGTYDNRRNIHTLDWSGNAVFAGDVTNGNGISLNSLKAAIDAIGQFKALIVEELPTEDISISTIYMILKPSSTEGDIYEEYINIDGTVDGWEHIGSTSVDLSEYAKKTELPTKVSQLENDSGYLTELEGADGKSAYEVAVNNGFVGTETEWLNSLKGTPGAKGDKGDKGDTGAKGDKGDTPTLTNNLLATVPGTALDATMGKVLDDKITGISSALNYSTTETICGTWTDGKPLYQKVVNLGTMPNNAPKEVPHGVLNIGIYFVHTAFVISPVNCLPVPFVTQTAQNQIAISMQPTIIYIHTANDRSAYTGYAVIRYTKTTD